MPARSASPITRSKNWATSFTSICRNRARIWTKGKTLGSVESVKAVSDIYAPVSGEVIGNQRPACRRAREAERRSARRRLAVLKIKLTRPDEIKNLLSAADYQKYHRS